MPKKRVKFKFQFKTSSGKQKYFWRIVSCNGRKVSTSGEKFLQKQGPVKTVTNLIKAIQAGEYSIEDYSVS